MNDTYQYEKSELDIYQYERSELAQVRAQLLHLFFIVGIFSFLVNLLLLTGPLYMLHI